MDRIALHAFPDEAAPASSLASALGLEMRFVQTHRFPDGEIAPQIPSPARTVIVYRSLSHPDAKLVELLLSVDAWRRAGVARLVLAAPYLCYMRQDAVFAPGQPLSQAVIGKLLAERFERVVTVDAHLHRTPRLEDVFVGAECANLSGAEAIAAHLALERLHEDLLIVGPDEESRPWVAALAARLGRECATFVKARASDRDVTVRIADDVRVRGRPILLLDDICSSGGTLEGAIRLLTGMGAAPVDVIVTHALHSDDTQQRLRAAGAASVRSCDSCLHVTNAIPLAPLLADALRGELIR